MNPLILVSVVVSILVLVIYLGCYKVNGIARGFNHSINGGERIYHIFIDRACENFDSEEKQIEFLLLRCHMIEEYVKYLELLKDRLDCLRMQNLCRSLYLEILKNLHADITDEKREKVYTLVTEESIKKYINTKLRKNKNYKVCFMSYELIRFAIEYIVANKELEIKAALETYKTEERTRLEQAMIKQAILINQKEGYRQEKSLLNSVIKFERNMLFFGKKDQKNLRNEIVKYDRAEIYFLHSTPPPFTHEILKNIDKQQFDPAKALIRMLEDLMQSKSKFDSANIKWYGPLGFDYSQKENDGGIDVIMSHVTARFGPDAAQIICSKFEAFKHLLPYLEPLVKRHICLYFTDNPAMKEAINLAIFNLLDELKKFMLSSEDRQQLIHAMTSYKTLKIKSKNFIDCVGGLNLQPKLKEKEKPKETLYIDHDSDDLFYLEDYCSINIVHNAANIY